MEIMLNGESRQVSDGCTAHQLVEDLGLGGRRIALEVNREIIPGSQHSAYRLREGDRVEIVHAIGGG